MVVLIDTNVIVDYLSKREPFYKHALRIVELCATREIGGCLAAHTIPNLFFILRKGLSVAERKKVLLELCDMFTIVNINASKIVSALRNDEFSDLEDCLQEKCAVEFNADYIVTRNICDFKGSRIKPIEPDEFLAKVFRN